MQVKKNKGVGRPRAKLFDMKIFFSVSEQMKDDIEDVADQFQLSNSEVIRQCIENDLPKLKDRLKKRTQRRTKQ